MSDVENQIISSKFVKEIIKLNGDIKKFTTKSTIKALKDKLMMMAMTLITVLLIL